MLQSSIKSVLQPSRLTELLSGRTSKRFRPAAVAVIALIGINVFCYLFLVASEARHLAEQQGKYAELKQQYAEALLFQKQKKALAGLEAGIPSQKDVPLLIKDLVQKAHRLNLSVGTINSDIPTSGGGGATMITFSVPATGTYANVKRFIFDVETSDMLVGIRELKLDSEKNLVKLDMKLVTYIRGE